MITKIIKKEKAKKVNKELLEIGREYYKTLNKIENELGLLSDALRDYRELNLNYDYYKERMYLFIDLLNSVNINSPIMLKNALLSEKTGEINRLYDNNMDLINKHGEEVKREVLEKLVAISTKGMPNEEKVKILKWILDKLELNAIDINCVDITGRFLFSNQLAVKKGQLSFCGISSRQIHSYELCLIRALEGKVDSAIDFLYDFVDNYQYSISEPFNSFERISIKNMIMVILKSMS